jgi:hypothetical protein
MALVVDASVALAWALPDESSAYAEAVLVEVEKEGLRVPELWAREIANGLAVAHRRKRITSADESPFLAALSHLIIDVEEVSDAIMSMMEPRQRCVMALPRTTQRMWILHRGKNSLLQPSTRRCARLPNNQGSRFSSHEALTSLDWDFPTQRSPSSLPLFRLGPSRRQAGLCCE